MRIGDFTEEEYYELIDYGMEHAIDRVASWEEWLALKKAALRWLATTEVEVRDGLAQGEAERATG